MTPVMNLLVIAEPEALVALAFFTRSCWLSVGATKWGGGHHRGDQFFWPKKNGPSQEGRKVI